MQEVKSVCCYCGVGCGVLVQASGDEILGVRGDPEHPSNRGRLCSKGASLHLTSGLEGRVLFPELRLSRGAWRRTAAWDEALDLCTERFADIITRHGPDAVGFYVSGQLLTEDYYVFNKLAKGLIGTNNIDSNSRLCMSSAVAGYKASLGVDGPPCCYDDIGEAGCLLVAGANPAYAHPIVFRRMEEAKRLNPELKVIVVDPRRTDSCSLADLHLAILPGSDVALFQAMLHVLIWEGLIDRGFIEAHTEGFEALKSRAAEYTPAAAAEICGVPAADIVQAARWFGQSKATLSLYCQGLNQSAHGTDKNGALINLHLASGHIGRPGAGPFSLTGQPNAMGGREVGGLANMLPAHRDAANPEHRAEVARLWGVPEVPARPGKTAVEMFEAVGRGEIKAIWIVCTNPAHSMPDLNKVHEALRAAEFVVLQEAFRDTETAGFADVLLPAATWPEKDGVMTNSERRVARVRPARPAPGEARPDWQIAVDFARRLEARLGAAGPGESGKGEGGATLFPYRAPEQIFDEHRECTRGRDLDITGIDYRLLEQAGPQQWPFPAGASRGRARLYEDGRFATPSGRARFADVRWAPSAERTDARFPLHLNTGRMRDQWHGMSRSSRAARLFNHVEEPQLDMHPQDMTRRGLTDGDVARVASRRGELRVRVRASSDLRPAQVFLPMHWGARFMRGEGSNVVTIGECDAVSRQPELKHCAVQVEKLDLPWHLVALAADAPEARLAAIRPLLGRFEYATCGLYGTDRPVAILRAFAAGPVDDQLLADVDAVFGLDGTSCALAYRDARRGVSKRIALVEGRVAAARLAGETVLGDRLKEMIALGVPADAVRPWLLSPLPQPAPDVRARGRIVCSCMNVSETEILEAAHNTPELTAIQAQLSCGTVCGSCVPEIKRLASQPRPDGSAQ